MLNIKTRQQYLKNLGYYEGKIDGKEGKMTKAAYKELQKKYFPNKYVDGIYGSKTETLLINAERVRLYAKNFRLEEFKCKCGKYCTGYPVTLDIDLLKNLQKVRSKFGATIIKSGLRCTKYNNTLEGSSKTSRHTKGKAVDVYISGSTSLNARKKIIDYYIELDNSRYAYCNGYYRKKNKKGTINASFMGSSSHLDIS